MTALTWTTLGQTLLAAIVRAQPPFAFPSSDGFFTQLYPRATSYAESRITQEIPMLGNRTEDTSQITVSGNNQISVTAMTSPIIVPETVDLITPASTQPGSGTRWSYDMTTPDVINAIWPTQATTLAPALATDIGRFWALLNASTIIVAPTPDGAYVAAVAGLAATQALSASQTTTYLSTNYPDLLTAACMVFLEGAMTHNFGAQAGNPGEAMSWEGLYQQLADVCWFEELRRRGLAPDTPRPRSQAAQARAA